MRRVRDFDDAKPNYGKKRLVVKFDPIVPCPYCRELQKTNLSFAHHILQEHNFFNAKKLPVESTGEPERRKLIVHGHEYWVTRAELPDELGVDEAEADKVWQTMGKVEDG